MNYLVDFFLICNMNLGGRQAIFMSNLVGLVSGIIGIKMPLFFTRQNLSPLEFGVEHGFTIISIR